ncbi:MAG: prephenate dehydrogenase [Gemmatimonadaceae bacterium]|nr:prephenate dehydrogenase [Gemmatimonadaceae bacterium]
MASPTVAVIGLGLIGGSVARALSARGVRVVGFDRNRASVDAAMSEHGIESELDDELNGIASADIIVLALPGDAAREIIPRLARLSTHATLVTDVGSAKQLVVQAAEAAGMGPRFVGSHPLAGDHRSAWQSSRADMFQGERVFLCPASTTRREAIQAAEDFWISLGAIPTTMDALSHDTRMAWLSHLPHVLSTALALTLRDAGLTRSELGRGGRDLTRLAGSSPEMWSAIALENGFAIAAAISSFEQHLEELKTAVVAANPASFKASFAAGREWFAEGSG